jgi:hypothetical protein
MTETDSSGECGNALAAKLCASPKVWPVSWAASCRVRASAMASIGSFSGVMVLPVT